MLAISRIRHYVIMLLLLYLDTGCLAQSTFWLDIWYNVEVPLLHTDHTLILRTLTE